VLVAQLETFCDFVKAEHKKLLQHRDARFISLLPASERVLEMFQGLKSYFCSQEQCAAVIKKFSENPCEEVYFQFVAGFIYLITHFLKLRKSLSLHRGGLGTQET
jgi:hypothetical protein